MFETLRSHPQVIVQGMTGRHGAFHSRNMLAAGTRIVAGVTPGKGGQSVHGVPIYDSVAEAARGHNVSISVVFVPPPYAKDALLEAVRAGIQHIICITEGIPVHDMLIVLRTAKEAGVVIVGPNCPGILLPGRILLGIIPPTVSIPGTTALVSRSGTLTYEAAASLSAAGIGQCSIIGIGGDKLRGLSFIDCLAAFQNDPMVERIVLIGEIGGSDEQQAADYIRSSVTKPVFAYVVGWSAPSGAQLGHAGAIMGTKDESAAAKTAVFEKAGAHTAASLPELISLVVEHTKR